MTKSDKALHYFGQDYNCAQSVFTVFGEDFGLTEDECLKVSCAFGGGMGRTQLTCGAVTGALMALGMKFGMGKDENVVKKNRTYEKTVIFINEFKKRHGSTDCKSLLQGLDMNDETDKKKIEALKLFTTQCPVFVKDAVEITEKILEPLSNQGDQF